MSEGLLLHKQSLNEGCWAELKISQQTLDYDDGVVASPAGLELMSFSVRGVAKQKQLYAYNLTIWNEMSTKDAVIQHFTQ